MMSYFESYGEHNPETIVFIHGTALSGWMWQYQVKELQADYHCLVPDLPAHGQNLQDTPFTIQRSVDAIARLITDHAHDSKAHLVGLSLGGLIVLEFVRKYPHLVKRAVISAPPSGPIDGTPFLIALTRIALPLFKSDFVIKQSAKQLKMTGDAYQHFWRDQKAMSGDTLRRIAREVHQHRLPVMLQRSEIPLLALLGEYDNKINYQVVRHLVRMMPSAQGRIAPNVGHGWNGENPTLFNQSVRQWLMDETIPDALLPLN
ncbi:MAG: alpha/beta hydrolase [Chloroflexota bacterium]